MAARNRNNISRDLQAARAAYLRGSTSDSRKAHSSKNKESGVLNEPGHGVSTRNILLQSSDKLWSDTSGHATCIFSCITYATLSYYNTAVLPIHLSLMVTYAITQALAAHRSNALELRVYNQERAREVWEWENFPAGEKQEMIELYVSRGMTSVADATKVIDLMSKYDSFFIDIMMLEELHLLPPKKNHHRTILYTLLAHLIWGLCPLFLVLFILTR